MKFLLEFVCCFAPSELSEESPNSYRSREDTQALMHLPYAVEDERSPRKTRGKLNSGSAAQWKWKPSLCAISEDKIVFVVTAKRERTVRSGEKLPGRTVPRVRVRYHENKDNNEYRRSPTPASFPAFTPTAFFF